MLLISHRGNINGRMLNRENTIEYINEALEAGYDVEIDVNYNKFTKELYLGHGIKSCYIDINFLRNNKLWCHCKTLNALELCIDNNIPNYFWHERDTYTLTSSGYIWALPYERVNKNTIIVCRGKEKYKDCAGLCSNFIGEL